MLKKKKKAHHPQLQTMFLSFVYAVVWSAPQETEETFRPSRAAISVGLCLSSASPWPSCPSSPLPHEQTELSAVETFHGKRAVSKKN